MVMDLECGEVNALCAGENVIFLRFPITASELTNACNLYAVLILLEYSSIRVWKWYAVLN